MPGGHYVPTPGASSDKNILGQIGLMTYSRVLNMAEYAWNIRCLNKPVSLKVPDSA